MSAVRREIQATPTIGGRVGAGLSAASVTHGTAKIVADKAIKKVLAYFMHCILRGMLVAVKPVRTSKEGIRIGVVEKSFLCKSKKAESPGAGS